MSGLFSAPAVPAAPHDIVSWTPASAGKPSPGALGYQSPLTRTSSGASLNAGAASAPGSAYHNTVLGEG